MAARILSVFSTLYLENMALVFQSPIFSAPPPGAFHRRVDPSVARRAGQSFAAMRWAMAISVSRPLGAGINLGVRCACVILAQILNDSNDSGAKSSWGFSKRLERPCS